MLAIAHLRRRQKAKAFYLDKGVINIKERGDVTWRSVYLDDAIKVRDYICNIQNISSRMQEILFSEEVREKAITPIHDEEIDEADNAPAMQAPV